MFEFLTATLQWKSISCYSCSTFYTHQEQGIARSFIIVSWTDAAGQVNIKLVRQSQTLQCAMYSSVTQAPAPVVQLRCLSTLTVSKGFPLVEYELTVTL